MSELINNARRRKEVLKELILRLHRGEAPHDVREHLIRLLGQVPYHEVVEVEQELISEGLPIAEVLKLCDIHTAAMKGQIDISEAKSAPPGHPVDTFMKENRAIEWELSGLSQSYERIAATTDPEAIAEELAQMRKHFHALTDVEKHYRRKENLLFPMLEKHGITGPSTVMWGKHDEIRELLGTTVETFRNIDGVTQEEAKTLIELVFRPTSDAISEMIFKEEQILLPMSLDKLTDEEWYAVYQQSPELGWCLYDPQDEWRPKQIAAEESAETSVGKERIQFPSGSMTPTELNAILNTIPFDLTFVDAEDKVRYFTQGQERIFERNRAILGRQVQLCHPPEERAYCAANCR